MPLLDKLNIAVFVDYDNIEIGLKTTLRREFDVSLCLDALKERGDIVAKFAYANWGRQEGAARQMAENAVQMVQRLPSPRGDKNGGDINLALDALEMAFTHTHVNAFAIISGDSDFIPLVNKLKEYGKTVYVVGGKAFTSNILQSNCHEFVAYENLLMDRAARVDGSENGPTLERLKLELADSMKRSDQGRDRGRGDRDRGDRDRGRGDRDRGDRNRDEVVEDRVATGGIERLPGERLAAAERGPIESRPPLNDRGPIESRPPLGDRGPIESRAPLGDRPQGRESRWERRDRRRDERNRGDRPEGGLRPQQSSEPKVVLEVNAALPLVERSLQTLERRGVQAQLGLLKSTMMQLDPTFHERGFGASSFSDFIDKLAKLELIDVHGSGGKLTIERRGGANAKPLPEPIEAMPLLRDALEAHRYEMEMGDGVEPGDLAQWMVAEHPNFDSASYGFPGFKEFLEFSQNKGVVKLKKDDERGLVVYLGREFFPPPAPKVKKEEEFYSEYDEIQPYVEGQPSIVEPNPPPVKAKKATTRAPRKTAAKKAASSTTTATGRTRKRKTE
ncbi:PIN domain-containing protein [Bryobacter aggregatus]|uniref:PIN domain-containing protein n=1 Tax=Bryobacter aggregatus TaxID=360054 RepID=UPI0009B5A049|nr:PIN domain-containing protein [Bryobacter aggregatus]